MDLTSGITVKAVVLCTVTAIFAGMFHSTEAMSAVAAGGLIALANFRLSSKMLKQIIGRGVDVEMGRGLALFSYVFRFVLLGTVLLIAVKSGVNPGFLIAGLSAVTAAVLISAVNIRSYSA